MKTAKLDKAQLILNSRLLPGALLSHIGDIDPRAILLVTAVFLLALLSVPLENLEKTIWFAVYPIITAPLAHIKYGRLFFKSLVILPFIVLIGMFNPIFDHRVAFIVGTIEVSYGWITFLSIILRGLLAFQALLLLIHISGFINLCGALQQIGVPKVLTVQLLMLYRYMGLIVSEAVRMRDARIARGYGNEKFPLGMWARLTGTLMINSIYRAKRISRAMDARGFSGVIYVDGDKRWNSNDTLYCFIWISVLLVLRFVAIQSLLTQLAGYS